MKYLLHLLCALGAILAGSSADNSSSAADSLASREQRAMQAALVRVSPSVVRIETVGGLEHVGRLLVGSGPTTGLVVSSDGFIISSAFNFVQKPDSILVTLEGGSRHAARLVATDHSRMLVLLKVDAPHELKVPEVVPQKDMRVGQWALAVGRTFDPSEVNVSLGIVSALGRIWGKAIQTDAKVSPNNYGGPLVDVAGRVFGVLVPMSPQGGAESAGVEWYDSGIGFAIPLETVIHMLPMLRQGHDLKAGLLGVSMQGADIFSQRPVLAAVRATSPAYKSGLRPGDQIIEVAGQPVTRQAELKHLLGPLYAGDKVRIVAMRGEERLEREIELVDKVEPYEYPFLGVLPRRDQASDKPGEFVVRYVYPDSAAATAGILVGDRIVSINTTAVGGIDDALERLQTLEPGQRVKIEVRRADQTLALEATLGRLPEQVPDSLPAAHAPIEPQAKDTGADAPPAAALESGVVTIKVPEFENDCVVYVPEHYQPRLRYGLVVWLHGPGGVKQSELIERWKPLCDQHDLILLAPKSSDRDRWQPTELRFVRRALDEVLKHYAIDRARVVIHGYEGGAAMAYLVGLEGRDVFRAVAAVDAPLPRVAQPGETDPVERMAFYAALPTKTESTAAILRGIERLRALKYPVTVHELGEQGRYLTTEELEQMVRWFDTLDRL